MTRSNLESAIRKAQAQQPVLYHLADAADGGFYIAPSSSRPGECYMLEVVDGKVTCECEGFEHIGVCYHAAALAMKLELLPERYLPKPDADDHGRLAPVVPSVRVGRKHLFD